jgi:hypothetical protein
MVHYMSEVSQEVSRCGPKCVPNRWKHYKMGCVSTFGMCAISAVLYIKLLVKTSDPEIP